MEKATTNLYGCCINRTAGAVSGTSLASVNTLIRSLACGKVTPTAMLFSKNLTVDPVSGTSSAALTDRKQV